MNHLKIPLGHQVIVVNSGNHIDLLAEIAQNFTRIFGRILKRDQLDLQIRRKILNVCPNVQNEFCRRHD